MRIGKLNESFLNDKEVVSGGMMIIPPFSYIQIVFYLLFRIRKISLFLSNRKKRKLISVKEFRGCCRMVNVLNMSNIKLTLTYQYDMPIHF